MHILELANRLEQRIERVVGRDNDILEYPDNDCIDAAGVIKELVGLIEKALPYIEAGEYLVDRCSYSYRPGQTSGPGEYGIVAEFIQTAADVSPTEQFWDAVATYHQDCYDDGIETVSNEIGAFLYNEEVVAPEEDYPEGTAFVFNTSGVFRDNDHASAEVEEDTPIHPNRME